jgi:hypothetical protein
MLNYNLRVLLGVVLVRLLEKESNKSFVVGTYHMPCMFGSDDKCSVMAVHLAMLFQVANPIVTIFLWF